MHRRSFASEETLPKATRRVRKQVRGNAEAWVSTLQKCVPNNLRGYLRTCVWRGKHIRVGGRV